MKLRKQFEGHSFGIGCIAWCPFSRYVIACGTDECNELWIWDVEVNFYWMKKDFVFQIHVCLARRTTITYESYIRR